MVNERRGVRLPSRWWSGKGYTPHLMKTAPMLGAGGLSNVGWGEGVRRRNQAEKEEPQPQLEVALGFLKTKPRDMISSLKSTVVPLR